MDPAVRISRRISWVTLRNLAFFVFACGAGCDSAVLSPTGSPPPTEPLTVTSIHPSVSWPSSRIEITGTGFIPGITVVMGNVPARNVDVLSGGHMFVTSPAHDQGTVDVVLTSLSGERAIVTSGYTNVAVTLTPDTDSPTGDHVTVTWSASSGRARDWVGLFEVGSPAMPWAEWGFEWRYTNGASSGTWRFRPDALTYPPGQYEFRYALEGNYNGWAAYSVPVTIR